MIIKTNSYFDGDRLISGLHYIKVEGSKITGIANQLKEVRVAGEEIVDCTSTSLLPGWIDIHINGGGGALFNEYPTPESLKTIVETHARYGTTAILPTLLSDRFAVMEKGLRAVNEVIGKNLFPGILGIHFEGPFIDQKRKGTHRSDLIQSPSPRKIEKILSYRIKKPGKKIITLAPEKFSIQQLKALKKADYLIMVGHTAAGIEEIEKRQNFFDGFTHFFNGMGNMSARDPGVIGYGFHYPGKHYLSLIVDRYHVHPRMLSLLFNHCPSDKIMMISDAMPSVAMKQNQGLDLTFNLQGKEVTLKEGLLVDKEGVISGAHLTLIDSVNQWLELWRKNYFSVDICEVFKMLSIYPTKFLGLDHSRSPLRLGRIKVGYDANITVVFPSIKHLSKMKSDLQVVATLSSGQWLHPPNIG